VNYIVSRLCAAALSLQPFRVVWLVVLIFAGLCAAVPDATAAAKRVVTQGKTHWNDGNFGEFDSVGALIEAFNQHQVDLFERCKAMPPGPYYKYSCEKLIVRGYTPKDTASFVNGAPNTFSYQEEKYTEWVRLNGESGSMTQPWNYHGGFSNFVCPRGFSAEYTNVSSDGKYRTGVCVQYLPDPTPCFECPEQPGKPPAVGNPVDTATGAKLHKEVLYADAFGRLSLARHYASQQGGWQQPVSSIFDPVNRAQAPVLYGPACRPSWLWRRVFPNSSPTNQAYQEWVAVCLPEVVEYPNQVTPPVLLRTEQGAVIQFKDVGGGVFKPSVDSRAYLRLIEEGGIKSWLLVGGDGRQERFSADGLLRTRVLRSGATLQYSYDGAWLSGITDHTGRSLGLQYVNGQPTALVRPDGQVVTFQPSASQLVIGYPDNSTKTLHFGEANLLPSGFGNDSSLLTGITDERGVRYAFYKYSTQGTVTQEYHAGGVNNYTVSVNSNYTQVTDPKGTQRTYYFADDIAGNRQLTSVSQPAGSGSAGGSEQYTYDSQSNLASRTQFNGNKTCYANDLTRNLEVARVEGYTYQACGAYINPGVSLPAGYRKTSTEWHPNWRLQTRVAEPGKLTTSVYNGQPDPFAGGAVASCAPTDALLPDGKPIAVVCKRVEQATTDANGASGFNATLQAGVPARQWSYTYNRWGQVLSEDGPRTDVIDVTTYEYYAETNAEHTQGDLKQVTNAAGQVTTYTKYNPHGQVLESVDANGTVTTNTYDLRQRLLSSTVAGQTTAYEYEPTGDLKKVTQPVGSWVEYGYDAARRLTSVSDSAGNSIVYTLDNAGNRTKEEVKDPGGVLARQLTRVYDALGRVQQTTGRE
jgi:YD repeat-containing protein